MKDSGRQKDRQRWERKEWASLVEKHPRRVKASPWGPSVEKADAATIYTEIKKVTDEVLGTNQWGEKLVAFGSDGASVMTGVKAGVVAKFRDWRGGHIVGVHCMAHRLELSFKDATKSIALHKKVDTLLLGLFYFYQRSALNRANLKKSYKTL